MDDHNAFNESRVLRSSLRSALGRAVAVTGCSQITLDDAHERFGLAFGLGTVVFNGIDLHEQAESADSWVAPFGRYVLAVGRLVEHKGFDLLVAAFAAVAAADPEIGLLILGDGPQRARLREIIEATGMGKRIALPGTASRAVVASAMADAEIFVMPSRIEPFGIVVLEAWRAGRPVLASSRGGSREFIDDGVTGLLVDPSETDVLVQALNRMLGNPELRARLGGAGRARVQEFSAERVTERYVEIYESLLAAEG